MSKFNMGDKILLKSYQGFTDYLDHYGEFAIVRSRAPGAFDFGLRGECYSIEWKDGSTSTASEENMVLIKKRIKQVLKVGSVVKYTSRRHGDHESNPLWGGKLGWISGVITKEGNLFGDESTSFNVKWGNGRQNTYSWIDLELIGKTNPNSPILV